MRALPSDVMDWSKTGRGKREQIDADRGGSQLLCMYISRIPVKLDRNAFRSAMEVGFWPIEKAEHQGCCGQTPPDSCQNRNPVQGSGTLTNWNKNWNVQPRFKDRMRRQWLNWMIPEGVVHGTTSPPTRLDVVKWVNATMLEMKGEGQMICNAWTRHGYEWFVDNVMEQDAGGNDMVPRGRFKS